MQIFLSLEICNSNIYKTILPKHFSTSCSFREFINILCLYSSSSFILQNFLKFSESKSFLTFLLAAVSKNSSFSLSKEQLINLTLCLYHDHHTLANIFWNSSKSKFFFTLHIWNGNDQKKHLQSQYYKFMNNSAHPHFRLECCDETKLA